jgi:hypothetical protein
MPRHHLIIDTAVLDEQTNRPLQTRVSFTKEEENAADTIDADRLAEVPMRQWENKMYLSERYMTHEAEDMIDSMDAAQFARLPQDRQDKYEDKKKLRGERP